MNKQVYFINWLRFFAVVCIFSCHLVQTSPVSGIRMMAQFLNIGVELFILISAYCFGIQGKIHYMGKWYLKRIKRIYIPYEIFVIVLAVVYSFLSLHFEVDKWIWCVSGLLVSVKGITHAWFVATILICYAATPILNIIYFKVNIKKLVLLFLIMPFVVTLIPNATLAAYLPHVFFYSVAYLFGLRLTDSDRKSNKENQYNKKQVVCCFFVIGLGCILRITGKFLLDGTVWYDKIISIYTQYLIAMALVKLFAICFRNVKPTRLCEYICRISFEIYLCHYMFVVGPISLMGITDFWLVNSLIVMVISVLLASILNLVNRKILNSSK